MKRWVNLRNLGNKEAKRLVVPGTLARVDDYARKDHLMVLSKMDSQIYMRFKVLDLITKKILEYDLAYYTVANMTFGKKDSSYVLVERRNK